MVGAILIGETDLEVGQSMVVHIHVFTQCMYNVSMSDRLIPANNSSHTHINRLEILVNTVK